MSHDDIDDAEMAEEGEGEGEEMLVVDNQQAPAAAGSSTAPALVPGEIVRPVLKGHLTCENSVAICRGSWAYNDAQHNSGDPEEEKSLQTPPKKMWLLTQSLRPGQ